MAEVTRLNLNFRKSNGDPMSMSFNYAKENASAANVKSLMEGIVANGDIYENIPATIVSAKFVTTSTSEVDLS